MWQAPGRWFSIISCMTDNVLLECGSRTNEPLPLRRGPTVILRDWLGRFVRYHIPAGYEDETGFHYGIKPTPNESSHSFDI
jgi:hypothetical protein